MSTTIMLPSKNTSSFHFVMKCCDEIAWFWNHLQQSCYQDSNLLIVNFVHFQVKTYKLSRSKNVKTLILWWRHLTDSRGEVIGLFNCSNCGRRSKLVLLSIFVSKFRGFFCHEYSLDIFLTPWSVYSILLWASQTFTVIYITLLKSF